MSNAGNPNQPSRGPRTPRALMRAAMRREPTPRIPCMPQICHDTPVRLYAGEEGSDWVDGIDAFYIGDPAASASLISPRHFEEFCLPVYQRFCRHFKGRDILIYIHVCGNSAPILEMLADTGADVVEPLDPLGGVSVADAKRRIGGRVALMGGVNTLTLMGGSPEEVRAEAIPKCREGGPHGYILAAGDMVPPGTSLANLQALVDVARRSSWLAGEEE